MNRTFTPAKFERMLVQSGTSKKDARAVIRLAEGESWKKACPGQSSRYRLGTALVGATKLLCFGETADDNNSPVTETKKTKRGSKMKALLEEREISRLARKKAGLGTRGQLNPEQAKAFKAAVAEISASRKELVGASA